MMDNYETVVRTKDIASGDLIVERWKIVTVELDPGVFTRHMFGWCPGTHRWQISSNILEDADDYIRTKTRKYWKSGESAEILPLSGQDMLMQFLRVWGRTEEEINAVMATL